MLRIVASHCLLLAVPVLLVGADNDTFDLRGKAPAKGTKLSRKGWMKTDDVGVTVKVNGKEAGKYTENEETTRERAVDITEVKNSRVAKVLYKLVSEQRKVTRKIGDKSKTDEAKGVLVGLNVIGERTKTGWKCTLEKDKPTDLQKAQLDELHFHELDGSVFTGKKVKV